jgi:hypothetical protein
MTIGKLDTIGLWNRPDPEPADMPGGSQERDAQADLGPCTTAIPTTLDVVVFVDIDKSVRWYQVNVAQH